PPRRLSSAQCMALLLAVPAFLWIVLFANNLGMLTSVMGFDSNFHLEYIDYIKTHWKLPLAKDGWQMYQPPLYYMISALLTVVIDKRGFSPDSIALLRLFGLGIGILQFVLVFLSLRLLA